MMVLANKAEVTVTGFPFFSLVDSVVNLRYYDQQAYWTEGLNMYAGQVARCPLVSHLEKDGTDSPTKQDYCFI